MIPIHEKKKNIQFLKAFASHIPCFEINEDLARAELERDDDAAYLAALPSARADAKRKAILSQVQLMDVVIRQLFLLYCFYCCRRWSSYLFFFFSVASVPSIGICNVNMMSSLVSKQHLPLNLQKKMMVCIQILVFD